ncbi:MAG: AfsR/SARP family transcriptional regulator, partial [Jatrophihabitantaceae bacterium]
DEELARLSGLLETGRLATVVGPGGAGKTRLAGVVASQWLDRLPDGVWLIELAPVTDEANLGQAMLSTLGIWADNVLEHGVEVARRPAVEQLTEVLTDVECLLVVDNCEHLISAVAGLVARLLGACPRLRVLATSREPLGIDGEALCLIAPLSLPAPSAGPAEATGHASVQLFADRAAAVSADFRIDAATVGPVVQIVRRLDGLPLAIELAAARLRVLPVAEIAARLSDRFRLLTGGSRSALPRHRTLRAVVEWSWDLLTDAERLLAERLAIFPSGASVDSAVAVCAGDQLPAIEVPELLSALVDKSLLQVSSDAADGVLRYQMLETIREYGIERLAERGELARLRLAHAQLFSRLAAQHTAGLRGRDQLWHLRALQTEWDNVLSGLGYLADLATDATDPVEASSAAEDALVMAYALSWYWMTLGRHSEAARWLSLVLAATAGNRSRRRLPVEAMYELNSVAATFGATEPAAAVPSFDRFDELFDLLGETDDGRDPLLPLVRAILTFFGGSQARSLAALEPALASPDPWIRASGLMFRAHVHENSGDPAGMREDAEAAQQLFSEIGDRWGMASTGTVLAQLKVFDGDLPAAIESYQLAARYMREFGALSDESMLHLQLSDLYLRIGNVAAAKDRVALSRDGDFQLGSRAQRLMTDAAEATIALVEGDLGAVAGLRDRLLTEVELLSPSPVNGHVMAIALAKLAELQVAGGQLDRAERTLDRAYGYGQAAHDMPIMAYVAMAVARWACAVGAPAEAAQIFGATAQLRGAPDPTDPLGRRLRSDLIGHLGEQRYQQEFNAGQGLPRADALARVGPGSVQQHRRAPAGLG